MIFVKYFNFLFFVLLNLSLYSQNSLNVVATYKLKTQSSGKVVKESNISEVREVLNGMNKNFDNLEYLLYCNSYSSIYFLKEKLQINDDIGYKVASIFGGSGIYYIDINKELKLIQKKAFGETFNVIYPLNDESWIIHKESKIIDGYTCFKATSIKEEYDYQRKMNITTNFIVWFTPDIPLPFGPKGFSGLPGLIMEAVINKNTVLYITNINFNSTDVEKKLIKPKKGKNITKDEYLKLSASIREKN
ncbi:GLPGLI family protein [Paucihalobacter sp.]|uniref:GLPGLI family protein n=1 Tax=Paucihalobacter sp. TaxID=2850405 RepID=UPI002FDF1542